MNEPPLRLAAVERRFRTEAGELPVLRGADLVLEAGEIVSTGTLTDAHPVAPGERWTTDLHGFAVRGLEVAFA